MPLITRRNLAPAKDPEGKPAPKTFGAVGETPVTATRGDLDPEYAPNVPPTPGERWFLPQMVSVAAGTFTDVSLPLIPERISITQLDAGSCFVALAPAAGGFQIPTQAGSELRIPGQIQQFSVVGPATGGPVRFLVMATSGYHLPDVPSFKW